MKIIREGVFETNSSSSHSLVIKKRVEPKPMDIPLGIDDYMVNEMGDCSYSEEEIDINRYCSQIEKLQFVINMLASVCDDLWNRDKMFANYDWKNREDDPDYLDQFWDEMINSVYFKALQEVVYEETETTIHFVRPCNDSIPFYDTVYGEENSVEELLEIDIDGELDIKKFKKRLKEIIFDSDFIIVYANIPYGCEGIDL